MKPFSILVTKSACQLKSEGTFIISVKKVKGGDIFKREDLTESTTEKPAKNKSQKGHWIGQGDDLDINVSRMVGVEALNARD